MQYDRIPRRYHLRWDVEQNAIIIMVHQDCIQFTQVIPRRAPTIMRAQRLHNLDELFDSFSGDLSSEFFGFNQSIRRIGQAGNYIELHAKLPHIKIPTIYACEECGGDGMNHSESYIGEKCRYCNGSKVKHIRDWRSAYALTASLSLLFMTLDFDEETSAQELQHATVRMLALYDQQGSSLDGYFGIDFIDFVCSSSDEFLYSLRKNVLQAMKSAHDQMFDSETSTVATIRTDISHDSIAFTVPGDACGINTGFYARRAGEGREFTCHNVDSPFQSLMLLAGIASLVEQVDLGLSQKKETLSAV